jgi:uncharacterized protein YbjT (DUF2867 family)
MRVIIFGATGMIGEGALIECLEDDSIETVLVVVRRPTGRAHPKLVELIHHDFLDYSGVAGRLVGYDACLFCLGISSLGVSEEDYRRVTCGFAIAAGEVLLGLNPGMRMCFVSGAGTDPNGRQMWARVKAEAEQALLAMPWKSAHVFRPALVIPRKGVVSRVRAYRIMYGLMAWAHPVLKALMPNQVTTSDHLGQAMIRVGRDGHPLDVLEGKDINAVGG